MDTHNSQISSGHHGYLAEMHKKALISTVPPLFFIIQVQFCFFSPVSPVLPLSMDNADSGVYACMYLNLGLYSKTASFFDHISHSKLLVGFALCSEGFLAVSLHLAFLHRQ